MCGIAGLYAFSASAPPADRAELRTIRDHMAARGRDGHGEWFSADGRVAFGHRRLVIIDLSEGVAQPMQSADGQLVITFNGEIYNYRELRREFDPIARPCDRASNCYPRAGGDPCLPALNFELHFAFPVVKWS